MSETKHTPGPWFIHGKFDDDVTVEIGTENGRSLAVEVYPTPLQDPGGIWTEEQIANARLIAAAPELLEALKYLRNYARLIDISDGTLTRVDAVIAKAEGGS